MTQTERLQMMEEPTGRLQWVRLREFPHDGPRLVLQQEWRIQEYHGVNVPLMGRLEWRDVQTVDEP